jgi:hypothetical protein
MSTFRDKLFASLSVTPPSHNKQKSTSKTPPISDASASLPVQHDYHFSVVNNNTPKMNDQEAFAIAVQEAKLGYTEGGVPVCGCALKRP